MSACRSQTRGPRDRKELVSGAQDSDEPEVTQSVTLNPEPYIP